ncbi:MAG: ATP-dependent helicase RhlE [Pseudomonadota bacterium]
MSFENLGLAPALSRALADAGYEQATEVQQQAIPMGLSRLDLKVSSQTGSGKTAAFALPALQRILDARGDSSKRREKGVVHGPRVLVLAPTRELAMQVAKAFTIYGKHVQGLRVATVVGGVPYGAQLKALRGPLDVVIATPGRLIDHLGTGKCVLDNLEMLVLDEADRMLDMGFIDDIRHIAEQTPAERQTVMFSATFAGHVGRLADELLKPEAQTVQVARHTDTHASIEQRLHWADNRQHKDALLDHLLADREVDQAVVFTSTQQDADWLADRLAEFGHRVASLHGGMPQGRRNRVLQGLRTRQLRVLVATDVAARGIDVPTISHVINYGMPMKAEDYVHRIGRTGRAGRNGLAVTLAERRDVSMVKRIQQFTTQSIPVAQVTGLEPQQPEPRIFMGAPRGAGGEHRGHPGSRFGGHGHPGARHGGRPGGHPGGHSGGRAPWGAQGRAEGQGEGRGEGYRQDRPQRTGPFEGARPEGHFERRQADRRDGGQDTRRGAAPAGAGRGRFGEQKPRGSFQARDPRWQR